MTCISRGPPDLLVFAFIIYIIYLGYREIIELKHQREMLRKARRYEAKEVRINMTEHALRAAMYFVIAVVTALFMWG